jgi:hypothetical protein
MIPRVNSSKVTRCTRARSRPAGRGPRTAVQRNAPGRSRLPSRARCRANPGCSRPRRPLPRRSHRRCGSVGIRWRPEFRGHPVHRFCGQDQELCLGALFAPRLPGEVLLCLVPPLAADETLDDVEIHAVEEQVRGAVAASVRPSRGTCPVVAARRRTPVPCPAQRGGAIPSAAATAISAAPDPSVNAPDSCGLRGLRHHAGASVTFARTAFEPWRSRWASGSIGDRQRRAGVTRRSTLRALRAPSAWSGAATAPIAT